MEGESIDIENEWIGVRVVDNDEIEHKIAVGHDGSITGHSQEAYPEAAVDQSPDDAVRLRQARRYAKYHVQRERGYQTLAPRLTPEWLPYALGAVFDLTFTEFEEQFGPYAQQYHSAVNPDIEAIVELPETEAPVGGIVYRADVFLGLEFESYLEDPAAASPLDAVAGITDAYDLYETLASEVRDRSSGESIEEVSALDLQYQRRASDGSVEEPTVGERSATTEGSPDAQLQLTPPQTTIESDLTTEIIQGLLCHHLQCQVRDAYLRLGLKPPEAFRVLGQGLAEQTMHYQHADVYPSYHLTDAEIDGYRPPGIEMGSLTNGAVVAGAELPPLRERLKRALFGSG